MRRAAILPSSFLFGDATDDRSCKFSSAEWNRMPARRVIPMKSLERDMKNFRKIEDGIDPSPILAEIDAVPGIWFEQTGRQSMATVQREALSIAVRGLRKSMLQPGQERRDVHASRWTTGSARLPHTRAFLERVANLEDGLLGRAKLVSLPAGAKVYPHVDRGDYYRVRDRYHLVLKSDIGSWIRAGDEEIRMAEGELWWFDNKAEHEAVNDSKMPRVHLIFDLLPSHLFNTTYADGTTGVPVPSTGAIEA